MEIMLVENTSKHKNSIICIRKQEFGCIKKREILASFPPVTVKWPICQN